ncbi:MAG: YceH family protein [Acidimicrobiales bacterium]
MDLTPEEVRVLGCLMEKQVTTPDQYPLSLNALVSASNQTTNRDPIVRYTERDVETALGSLRERGLTRIVYSPSNRVPKHRHIADDVLDLDSGAQAVLTVLLLRGAQTLGEIKGRTERMHAFDDLGEVERVIDALAARPDPLVVRLNRRPGQKEQRVMHLAGGPVSLDDVVDDHPTGPTGATRLDRIAELEARVAVLEETVERFRALLD